MWTSPKKARRKHGAAGKLMREAGLMFDVAHTSVLKRAIRTLHTALGVMEQMWIPVHKSWRLNERHYGKLQGLDKAETTAKYGEAQVKIWRRSYDVPPPPMDDNDGGHPKFDRRYSRLDQSCCRRRNRSRHAGSRAAVLARHARARN